jgi:hypothetical protein
MPSYLETVSRGPQWLHADPWYVPGVERLATTFGLVENRLVTSLGSAPVGYPTTHRPSTHFVGYPPVGRPFPTEALEWSPDVTIGQPEVAELQVEPKRSGLKSVVLSPIAFVGSRPPGHLASGIAERDLEDTRFLVTVSRSSAEILRRTAELLRLADGWDSQGGQAIRHAHVQRMLRFLGAHMCEQLPPPSIVPMSDGGVQIEWHRRGLDVEVTFTGGEDDALYCFDLATGEEWEGAPDEGFWDLGLGDRLAESRTATA